MTDVAMTLRLTDEETEALRRQAEREGRSMQAVARAAIRDRVQQADVVESAARGAQRYREVLKRLADA